MIVPVALDSFPTSLCCTVVEPAAFTSNFFGKEPAAQFGKDIEHSRMNADFTAFQVLFPHETSCRRPRERPLWWPLRAWSATSAMARVRSGPVPERTRRGPATPGKSWRTMRSAKLKVEWDGMKRLFHGSWGWFWVVKIDGDMEAFGLFFLVSSIFFGDDDPSKWNIFLELEGPRDPGGDSAL